jgi:transcriptional regulator with XRE-family HTH domain
VHGKTRGGRSNLELRDLLRREIDQRHISQAAAAKEMGVSQPVLSRWLADPEQVPSTENCIRVASFIHQPVVRVLQLAGRIPMEEDSAALDAKWERVANRELLPLLGPEPYVWEWIAKNFSDLFRMGRKTALNMKHAEEVAARSAQLRAVTHSRHEDVAYEATGTDGPTRRPRSETNADYSSTGVVVQRSLPGRLSVWATK